MGVSHPYLVDGDPAVLADRLLEEEARQTHEEQHDEVRDEEGAAAILKDPSSVKRRTFSKKKPRVTRTLKAT